MDLLVRSSAVNFAVSEEVPLRKRFSYILIIVEMLKLGGT